MTERPHVDEAQLEEMLRASAVANACPSCPEGTRRTTRRCADGSLDVRCVGCGAKLVAATSEQLRQELEAHPAAGAVP